MGVDIGSDKEPNDVEEWNPGLFGEELLGEGKSQWRSNPADLHDREETGLDGGADLVEGAGASDNGHGGQVDDVLDGRYLVGLIPNRALAEKDVQSSCWQGSEEPWPSNWYDQRRFSGGRQQVGGPEER